LVSIATGMSTGGLSAAAARRIFYFARLLLACRSAEDVTVFAEIRPAESGRQSVAVTEKWDITFAFSPGLGATDLRLEKLRKHGKKN
jgi:hypothetical protein